MKKGFTLIELLIVIGIIAILAAALIVGLSPAERFAQARDATRERHLRALNNALIAYQVDKLGGWGDLNISIGTYEICNTNKEGVVCGDLLDLSTLVTGGYISTIPVDPQKDINQDDSTGYYIQLTTKGITLVANFETKPVGVGLFVFEVNIPLGGAEYIFYTEDANFIVDWGDEEIGSFSGSDYVSHNYDSEGIYTVTLEGSASLVSFSGPSFPFQGIPEMLHDIPQPISANFGLTSARNMFRGIELESFSAPDFFDEASGNITDMASMFSYASNFNQDISSWDTSSVVNIGGMFYHAHDFDQPINNWNTSNVLEMHGMFWGASSFDQPLNDWDVSGVVDMSFMFRNTTFDQSLDEWDVSSLEDMTQMFYGSDFNQDISGWDTSNVLYMYAMFDGATSFDQPLNSWNTSSVTLMNDMFWGATSFDQPLDEWNTSSVTNMSSMFRNAAAFNRDISGWCVELIEDKPWNFDDGAGFEGQDHLQPDWGAPCI